MVIEFWFGLNFEKFNCCLFDLLESTDDYFIKFSGFIYCSGLQESANKAVVEGGSNQYRGVENKNQE